MRIALIGISGMLGSKSFEVLASRGHTVLAPTMEELDLRDRESVGHYFAGRDFDVLVNCAAYTAVDACEDGSEYPKALHLNATAVDWLAQECETYGRILVHYSTDYVFDGLKESPYEETDGPDPLSAYGRTKLMGEQSLARRGAAYYLVRTSWLYGPYGRHFIGTIAALLKERDRIEVVDDQRGAPTYTGDLAHFTAEILEKGVPPGLYHFSNEGETTWWELACEIQRLLGLTACRVEKTTSDRFVRPAKRPANSRLDLDKSRKAVGHGFRPWPEPLREFLMRETP